MVVKDDRFRWHSLDVEEVSNLLDVDPARGLTGEQARERQNRYGPNKFGELSGPPWHELLLAQFRSLVVLLLLIAVVISLLLGEKLDALAIGAAILLNALIGFFTESRAEQALRALKKLSAPEARVVRAGEQLELPASELVPGDVMILPTGARVPADGRLFEDGNLTVNESLLTGESDWVPKQVAPVPEETPLAERNDMVYLGSIIAEGHGAAIVTATGPSTEVGRIGRLISETPHEETPLEYAIEGLGRRLVWVILAAAALVIGLGLWHREPFLLILETGVTLAIAAIPEGLPAVTTIALAFGLRRLVAHHAIVRRLPAVEALGSTTVICADKTGTLTEGVMTARMYATLDGYIEVAGVGYEPSGGFFSEGQEIEPKVDQQLTWALRIGALCNNATYELDPAAGWHVHGDAVEAALLVAGAKAGIDKTSANDEFPRVGEVPFDERLKYMITFHRHVRASGEDLKREGQIFAFVKGAPEVVFPVAARVYTQGGPREMTLEDREKFEEQNRTMAQRGLRVMALAFAELPQSFTRQMLEGTGEDGDVVDLAVPAIAINLTLVALVGMADPPRPGIKEGVARCHRAGIRTVMITGDQLLTAVAVARELGLGFPRIDNEPHIEIEAMEARDLPGMDTSAAQRVLNRVSVFARVEPRDKLLIVQALERTGEIVAMTGDGVNDAPALRAAHIGVAMGKRGADVAKEAAAMVITDDNFTTIVEAIELGRIIYSNIRRAIRFLLTASFSAIIVVIMAIPFDLGLPLLPLQILYLNVIVHVFPAMGLALEPGSRRIMEERPRDPHEPILPLRLMGSIFWRSVLLGAAAVIAFFWAQYNSPLKATTIAFAALALGLLLHMFNSRSEHFLLFQKNHRTNPYVWLAFAIALALQLAGIYAPPLQIVLRTVPLDAAEWVVVLTAALVPAILVELSKILWPVEYRQREVR